MKKFLDLGLQPITNSFLSFKDLGKEFLYNLSVGFDEDTSLVSLINFIEPDEMFTETYAHRASLSSTMRSSFKKVADVISTTYRPDRILEIGSNDGVFIRNFDPAVSVAVEPCSNLAEITESMGYSTYAEFWDCKLAEKILKDHGMMDVIYSANTICHIPNLTEVFKAINLTLSPKGVFIFEDPYLVDVLRNVSYDQFYDEHAHIFSVLALSNLLQEHSLKIVKVEHLTTHGGSNRIFVQKRAAVPPPDESVEVVLATELGLGVNKLDVYEEFASRVKKSKLDLLDILSSLKDKNKRLISYGATYKSATIFNYCGIGTNFFDYVVDTTPDKQNKLTPGSHIPIISPEQGFNKSVDAAYLGAWNFEKEIINNEKSFLRRGGCFVSHVPHPRIIDSTNTSSDDSR